MRGLRSAMPWRGNWSSRSWPDAADFGARKADDKLRSGGRRPVALRRTKPWRKGAFWDENSERSLKSAFELTRKAGPVLRAAKKVRPFLRTVSRLDVCFGPTDLSSDRNHTRRLGRPGKTAAREWPELRCKAIDAGEMRPDSMLSAHAIVDENLSRGPVEIEISGPAKSLTGATCLYPSRGAAILVNRGDVDRRDRWRSRVKTAETPWRWRRLAAHALLFGPQSLSQRRGRSLLIARRGSGQEGRA